MGGVPGLEEGGGSNTAIPGGTEQIFWLRERSHPSGILKVWAIQPSWRGGGIQPVSCWSEEESTGCSSCSAVAPSGGRCLLRFSSRCIPAAGWVC